MTSRHTGAGVARRAAHHERQAAERALAEEAPPPAEECVRLAPAAEVLDCVEEVPSHYRIVQAKETKQTRRKRLQAQAERKRLQAQAASEQAQAEQRAARMADTHGEVAARATEEAASPPASAARQRRRGGAVQRSALADK